jgi:hypothetical protein
MQAFHKLFCTEAIDQVIPMAEKTTAVLQNHVELYKIKFDETFRCLELSVVNHATLTTLRDRHPAWRLLASPHAPLVASFLHRVFVAPNVRVISGADLAEALEDELFALREQLGPDAYPNAKGASGFLTDWCAPDKGWLRKFYKSGTDEAQFDLTPATEKAIA